MKTKKFKGENLSRKVNKLIIKILIVQKNFFRHKSSSKFDLIEKFRITFPKKNRPSISSNLSNYIVILKRKHVSRVFAISRRWKISFHQREERARWRYRSRVKSYRIKEKHYDERWSNNTELVFELGRSQVTDHHSLPPSFQLNLGEEAEEGEKYAWSGEEKGGVRGEG